MADTITPNMGLTKPEIGASANSWGNKLNENFNILDAKAVRNTNQWTIKLGDDLVGSLAGPFVISRYNNSAVKIDEPLIIDRQTGEVTVLKALNAPSINVGFVNAPMAKYAYQPSAPAVPAAGFANIYLDAAGNPVIQKPDGTVQYLGVPPGTVAFTGGATADIGWALLNGQAISRTSNPAVFIKFGTTFGVGDGSTTFNLPDLRGRVIAHAGTGVGLTARVLAELLGAETHMLTAAQIPAHTHPTTVTDPGHTHGTTGTLAVGVQQGAPGGGNLLSSNSGAVTIGSNTTGITVVANANTGGGGSHPIIQPTMVLNAQVKLG